MFYSRVYHSVIFLIICFTLFQLLKNVLKKYWKGILYWVMISMQNFKYDSVFHFFFFVIPVRDILKFCSHWSLEKPHISYLYPVIRLLAGASRLCSMRRKSFLLSQQNWFPASVPPDHGRRETKEGKHMPDLMELGFSTFLLKKCNIKPIFNFCILHWHQPCIKFRGLKNSFYKTSCLFPILCMFLRENSD